MASQYIHLPLNDPVEFISASYWISQEAKLPYKDEEVLCIVRETSCVSCCDGSCSPGFISLLIPGIIRNYKYKKGEDGLFVSEVDPIEDEGVMEEVRKIALEKYPMTQVEFFCP